MSASNAAASRSPASYPWATWPPVAAGERPGGGSGGAADPSVFGIEWNAEGELTRVSKNDSQVAVFKYDALGRRVEQAEGAVTLTLWDRSNVLRRTVNGTGTSYVAGPRIDEPLAGAGGSGVTTYFHADGLWSVVASTGADGGVTQSARFDVWGNAEGGSPSPFGFTGREHDDSTGLLYLRYRYYAPETGRFLSEDPLGWDISSNFYPYVDSNPATAVDPFGLAPVVSCPSCGRRSPRVQNAASSFCSMARTNKGCREALRYFGPPGGLLPCVEAKCATQIEVRCTPKGASCGGCGGPCNALSDPKKAVFLQPDGFKDICGSLGNTFTHEMAHLCGIGEDAGSGAGQKKNRRDAETVALLCGGL